MQKNIKLFLSILVLIFISPLTFANSDYEELDSIIAIVENDVITKNAEQFVVLFNGAPRLCATLRRN